MCDHWERIGSLFQDGASEDHGTKYMHCFSYSVLRNHEAYALNLNPFSPLICCIRWECFPDLEIAFSVSVNFRIFCGISFSFLLSLLKVMSPV